MISRAEAWIGREAWMGREAWIGREALDPSGGPDRRLGHGARYSSCAKVSSGGWLPIGTTSVAYDALACASTPRRV